MDIKIHSISDDLVINSKFITGMTNYEFAVKRLFPLIDKLSIQRSLQNPSFYARLRHDLLKGCVIPPITLAIISDKVELPLKITDAEKFIIDNIDKTFILDGIQRINSLFKTYKEPEIEQVLDLTRPLFVNIIVCKSMDNLLYRMITLNNGQKPMSANHQIEILLGNVYQFDELNILIQTEKEKGKKGKYENAFDKSNLIKAYLGFLANSTAIDNKKIIESKLDELIADKILRSNITEDKIEFSQVISLINQFSVTPELKKWFDNANNIIGFCVGIKKSHEILFKEDATKFLKNLTEFENAFKSLNLSAIKLSKERRQLTEYFISNYEQMQSKSELEILDKLNENT